ncbi:MAG TPA: histidine phosphatase family protein [Candidatus Sulfotelmatobacter sp.]|nr:histidine phosphatase family protein [Candidatus Sulfotelmatobacter sp.]
MAHVTLTRLLLVRHAEVEVRYHKIFGGRIDMNLSPRGHDQAALLAKFLHTRKLDAVYASPMKRVQQTLAPYLKNGAPVQTVVPDLREVDFGDWTGLNWEQVSQKFQLLTHEWLEHIERGMAPNGETGPQFRARVEPALRGIIKKHPGKTVGIFCHGGVIRMILSILLEIPLPRTNMFEIEYAGATQIALYPERAEIELLNFAPWRDAPHFT